ncbi:MAG: spermidine/putrescine ABC transporter substrate-binding protein [Anaerolineae bacterium]|nr:spermidine/putrescine ABC transporter substrate-binding protein [Anaerolineae bacterium]
MRIRLWMLVGLVVVALAVPALAQDTEMESWTCPDGFQGQTLNVLNWTTYISPEDDPETPFNENLIQNFEQLCGVTVQYDEGLESTEFAIALFRRGNPGYDIAVPSDYGVSTLAAEGLLEPLDHANMPTAVANVSPSFAGLWYDPENTYSFPYMWGTIAIGYDRTKTGMDVTSWYDMFNYSGPVAWLEDRRNVMGVALTLLGLDPNSENPDEIAQARDLLIDNSANVVSIAQDDGQELLARGDVDMTIEYNGDIFQKAAECEENPECTSEFVYVIPEEGAPRWVDNLVIPAGAPNHALAEVFIDYLYDPQVAAVNANYIQYGSPNQVAIDEGLIDEALLDNPGIYPTAETEALLFETYDLPDAQIFYDDAWEEIKLAISR